MKKLFYSLLLITSLGFSQSTEFTFTKDGITDYLVVEVPGKTAAELYQQTISWINTYYKTPEKVIKAKIENDYIRIEGFAQSLIVFNVIGKTRYDGLYQLEISFQEGKYKFDVISVDLLNTKSDPHMTLTNMSEYYKPDGKLKNLYKYYPYSFTSYFNGVQNSLYEYLNGTNTAKKKDW